MGVEVAVILGVAVGDAVFAAGKDEVDGVRVNTTGVTGPQDDTKANSDSNNKTRLAYCILTLTRRYNFTSSSQPRQDNGLLLLVFPLLIRVRDFTFFICFEEQHLGDAFVSIDLGGKWCSI